MFTVFLFVSPTDAGRPDFCSKRKKNSTQNTQLEQRLAPLSISSPLKWPKKHKNRKALHHSRKLRKDAIRMLTFKKKNNQAIVYLGPIKGSVSLQPIVQRRKITGRPWKSSTNLLPQFASGEEKLEIAQRIAPSGICFAGYREYSEKTTQRAPPSTWSSHGYCHGASHECPWKLPERYVLAIEAEPKRKINFQSTASPNAKKKMHRGGQSWPLISVLWSLFSAAGLRTWQL